MVRKRRGESADFALSQAQAQAVLKVCLDLVDKIIIGLMLWLGLREGEIAHLDASWVTQEGNIKIPLQQKCSCAECARMRGGMWKPKTPAGARTLPIPKQLRKDLSELLSIKPYGLGISRVAIYYRTKIILKRAKVKYGFPHCLRATCFNMLAHGGMSAVNLCAFAGWKNIAIGSHYIQTALAKQGAIDQAREIFG